MTKEAIKENLLLKLNKAKQFPVCTEEREYYWDQYQKDFNVLIAYEILDKNDISEFISLEYNEEDKQQAFKIYAEYFKGHKK
jgi:hypothetical protein